MDIGSKIIEKPREKIMQKTTAVSLNKSVLSVRLLALDLTKTKWLILIPNVAPLNKAEDKNKYKIQTAKLPNKEKTNHKASAMLKVLLIIPLIKTIDGLIQMPAVITNITNPSIKEANILLNL